MVDGQELRKRVTANIRAARERKAQQVHDTYVEQLEQATSIDLHKLTYDGFKWLVGRFITPHGRSLRAAARMEYLHWIASNMQADAQSLFRAQHEAGMVKLADYDMEQYYRESFDLIKRGEWPLTAAIPAIITNNSLDWRTHFVWRN